MSKKKKEELERDGLRITPIKEGTVIDKITPPQHCFKVLEILGIKSGTGLTVSMVMNVFSPKLRQLKSIVKIENRELTEKETAKIAVVAPTATVNIIRDFEVIRKHRVKLPKEIIGILGCPNPSCITNDKKDGKNVTTRFGVSAKPLAFRCEHCEREIGGKEIANCVKC